MKIRGPQPGATLPAPATSPAPASAPVPSASPANVDDFSSAAPAREYPIRRVPLGGPISEKKMQISGMAWSNDTLVLLPQFPRFGGLDGRVFVVTRAQLDAHATGAEPSALVPRALPINADGLHERLPGFDGFEAIAFQGDRVFLLAEAKFGERMGGYLLSGTLTDHALTLDLSTVRPLMADSVAPNIGFEALVVADGRVLVLPEAGGAKVNAKNVAYAFDLNLTPLGEVPLPRLEYRLTDATPPDADGRFWVANYNHPGEKGMEAADDGYRRFGRGPSHGQFAWVERLIEYQVSAAGVQPSGAAPMQLELESTEGRNWEAIARRPEGGFVLMTDEHPEPILALVDAPEDAGDEQS